MDPVLASQFSDSSTLWALHLPIIMPTTCLQTVPHFVPSLQNNMATTWQSTFCRQLHILGPSASNQHGNNMFADSSTLWPLPPWESLGIPLEIFVLGFDVRFLVKFRFWFRICRQPFPGSQFSDSCTVWATQLPINMATTWLQTVPHFGPSPPKQHGNNMAADST